MRLLFLSETNTNSLCSPSTVNLVQFTHQYYEQESKYLYGCYKLPVILRASHVLNNLIFNINIIFFTNVETETQMTSVFN